MADSGTPSGGSSGSSSAPTVAQKSGYVNGSDLLLYFGEKAVGHCTTHTTTFDTETKDRAVKPVASATLAQALWKSSGVTGLSVTISFEGLAFYDETEFGVRDLLNAWSSGKSVEVKCMERGSTDPYLKGKFVLTQLEEDAPAQDDVTYKGTLKNDGAPDVLDSTKITQNTAG